MRQFHSRNCHSTFCRNPNQVSEQDESDSRRSAEQGRLVQRQAVRCDSERETGAGRRIAVTNLRLSTAIDRYGFCRESRGDFVER
jgi:hypothetical protein